MPTPLHRLASALALVALFGCREEVSPRPRIPVTVLVTASLEEFAREAAEAFRETANAEVTIRSGSTHELAAELAAATTSADLFLATGTHWMDRLERKGRIVPDSRWEAVGNRMVILGRQEAGYPPVRTVDMATLRFRRLVVADPVQEPAGVYAKRWLMGIGPRGRTVWNQLEPRLVTVTSIAKVKGAIAEDDESVGVVFATDIGTVSSSRVLFRSPDLGIVYSFALVDRQDRPREARELLDFLRGPDGIDLLQMNGFLVEQ